MTTWTYIWIALMLKIPAVGFVWLVWRALRGNREQQPLPAGEDGQGGAKRRLDPHPRPRAPRTPRRGGPHGAAPLTPPARIRSVRARAACKVGR